MSIVLSLGLGWLLGCAVYGFLVFAPRGENTATILIKITAAVLLLFGSINIIAKVMIYHGSGSENITAFHIYFFSSFLCTRQKYN